MLQSSTGALLHVLHVHFSGEIHVLEAHPRDPRVAVSAGYDGGVVLIDVETGTEVWR